MFTAPPRAVAARPGQWCSTSGGGVGTGVGTAVGDGVAVGVGAGEGVGVLVGTAVATGVGDGEAVSVVDPHPASRTQARSIASHGNLRIAGG